MRTHGIPPISPEVVERGSAQRSNGTAYHKVPTVTSFAGEAPDFVLFPEGYISGSDQERTGLLTKLASDLGAPLLVGTIDRSVDSFGRAWQVLLRFDPDGSRSRVYAKHSTA